MNAPCKHGAERKHGRDRYGRQRFRCNVCGSTWSGNDRRNTNRLPADKEARLQAALAEGLSVRQIASRVGVSKQTVARRIPNLVAARTRTRVGQNGCDWCGKLIGTREFHRRTRRTKHKFCGNECYQLFYKDRRKGDKCALCGVGRYDDPLKRQVFVGGYCTGCRGILRQYGFDEDAAAAHLLNQKLRKEVRNV